MICVVLGGMNCGVGVSDADRAPLYHEDADQGHAGVAESDVR